MWNEKGPIIELMDAKFVGGKVEVIRPQSGESLSGTCLSHTNTGYVVEVDDEEVFGSTPVVAWLQNADYESVIQGTIRKINGTVIALRATGEMIHVSSGRENRFLINGMVATCEQGHVDVKDAGCNGFGFRSDFEPRPGETLTFCFPLAHGEVELPGKVIHSRNCDDGFMGGVELDTSCPGFQKQWLAVLAMAHPVAA